MKSLSVTRAPRRRGRGFRLLVAGLVTAVLAGTAGTVMASAQSAAPDIRPVSWWEAKYREDMDYYRGEYTWRTRSGDSWYYYEAAYGIDDPVAMYLASGDTEYLDEALAYVNYMVADARPSSTLGSRAFGDDYLGWISHENGSRGEEEPLYESYAWRYVTRLLLVIRQDPGLYSTYRAEYDALLEFTEVNIFDKWYDRGVEDYIYRENTHMAAHWAYIAMNLSLMTTDQDRLAREKQVFEDINFHLPNYGDASLHGQMVTSPVNANAYFWNGDWGRSDRPGSDVSHGNNVIAYVVEAHDLNLGAWTDADMRRFVTTFDEVIWPTDGRYAEFVDGSGEDNGWFSDGWFKLGRYDADLQKRLEDVRENGEISRSDGNCALNAKLLLEAAN